MDTNENFLNSFEWNNNVKNKDEKEVLARKIASKVNDGDVISFGSGTTSFLAVKEIAKKSKREKINIIAVPTSQQIKLLCDYLNIKTVCLGEKKINWGFDGADEVDENNWLIKGRGGALYKEKMNIRQTPVVYILVDKSKFVKKLGEKCYIPVECDLDKISYIKEMLKKIGAIDFVIRINEKTKETFITENGKCIIDVKFEKITKDLEGRINEIDGVLENGLFIGYENIKIIK